MGLNHNFAWHQSIIRELRFFCLVTSVGQRKSSEFPMRNRTSDLRIPCSDALPLSFWDSTVSGVYYEVQKTRLHHTASITKYSIYKSIIVGTLWIWINVLCSWASHFIHRVCLSTLEYKWVTTDCQGSLMKCCGGRGGGTWYGIASHPVGSSNTLSRFMLRKLG